MTERNSRDFGKKIDWRVQKVESVGINSFCESCNAGLILKDGMESILSMPNEERCWKISLGRTGWLSTVETWKKPVGCLMILIPLQMLVIYFFNILFSSMVYHRIFFKKLFAEVRDLTVFFMILFMYFWLFCVFVAVQTFL